MTLQRKTLLIFSVSFLCLLATLYFVSSLTLQASIRAAERDSAQRTLRASRGLLGQMVDQFSHRFADWAAWDDAAVFVQNGNREFIKSNLANESLNVLHVHAVVFLNAAGRPVFATGFDTKTQQTTPVPPRVWDVLKDPKLTKFKTFSDSHDGLLMVGDRLMLLTLRPIVTTELKGPQRGTIVVGRYLDAMEMRRLAEWGGVSLSIWSLANGHLPTDFQTARTALQSAPEQNHSAFTLPLSASQLGAYGIMSDIQGKPSLLLQAVVPRDAYARGLASLRYLVIALFVSALVFGLVTVFSLRRLVLAPLTGLSDEVRRVRDTSDPKARINISGERELATLGGDINGMLAALEQSQTSLHESIAELERRSRELTLVGEMGEMLQSCRTREEAGIVIVQSLRRLFPEEIGALCMMNASQDRVEVSLSWGESEEQPIATQCLFTPDECWALRRGHIHAVGEPREELVCAHIRPDVTSAYLCLPLMAERQTLGVLNLMAREAGPWPEPKFQLARTVAEQISLALFNLELQATLRNQSVRDPLTGLFNRRYMEESLARELSRAERQKHQVALILFDADHFKKFNDTFGHEAGDLVLKEIAQVLQAKSRKMDIACRYGGEEFLLILPDCPLRFAVQRAEQLRETTKALMLSHGGQRLNQVTLSLGVVCYPDHGSAGDALIRAADALLYQAKKAGRDCVVAGEVPVESDVATL